MAEINKSEIREQLQRIQAHMRAVRETNRKLHVVTLEVLESCTVLRKPSESSTEHFARGARLVKLREAYRNLIRMDEEFSKADAIADKLKESGHA